MPASVTAVALGTPTSVRFSVASVTGDNSYPTGGYALTPAQLGVPFISFLMGVAPGYVVRWSKSTGKLLFYRQTAATGALVEVANAVDLSTIVADVFVAYIPDGFSGA